MEVAICLREIKSMFILKIDFIVFTERRNERGKLTKTKEGGR